MKVDAVETARQLRELALQYHKADKPEGEGEYGCPGQSCPGVQRLVAFAEKVAALVRDSEGADEPLHTGDDERLDLCTSIRNFIENPEDDPDQRADDLEAVKQDLDKLDALIIATIRAEGGRADVEPTKKFQIPEGDATSSERVPATVHAYKAIDSAVHARSIDGAESRVVRNSTPDSPSGTPIGSMVSAEYLNKAAGEPTEAPPKNAPSTQPAAGAGTPPAEQVEALAARLVDYAEWQNGSLDEVNYDYRRVAEDMNQAAALLRAGASVPASPPQELLKLCRELFAKFVRHDSDCAKENAAFTVCTCGLNMLRDSIEASDLAGEPSPQPEKRERELCSHCGGNGTIKIPGGVSTCPNCDGYCWEYPVASPHTPKEQS